MTINTATMILEDILDDKSNEPKRPRIAQLIGEITLDRGLGQEVAQRLIEEYRPRILEARP